MAQDSSQKTEKPTPRRLKDAKKKGQIPKSVDLVQWLTLLAATFLLPSLFSKILRTTASDLERMVGLAALGEVGPTLAASATAGGNAVLGLAPLLAFVAVAAIVGMTAQGGIVLTGHQLKPKWERVSPKAGIKRLFSVQSLMETAKAVGRLAVLGVLVATTLIASSRAHFTASGLDLETSTHLLIDQLVLVLRLAALVGSIIGLGDYAFQRWQTMKKLKMSKQEIKEEQRSSDGDPAVRNRRRAAHAKLSRNQMLVAVKDATVVVVNPTHYAVALSYNGDDGAPVVVAKGTEILAWRIRERARIGNVPIVESPPLTRALYASADVGQAIPEEFFEAVAIVLAFVMRRRSTTSQQVRRVSIPPSKLPATPTEV